jgi:hypothetical protein
MRMGRRLRRLLGTALAGLVVLALLIVAARRVTERASPPPYTATAPAVGVVRADDGLRLSFSVPRGPYFRDELLPVTLVLANNSGRPIPLAGTYFLGSCQLSPLDVTMTSGGRYLPPVAINFSPQCPRPRQPSTLLSAGKSLRARILLGLPTSGLLTLTGQAFFAPNARVISPGLLAPSARLDLLRHIVPGLFRSSHAPFASGWPHLTIWVMPHAPAERTLRLVRRGHVVYVQGYRHTLPPLVVEQLETDVEPQGTCEAALTSWTPLAGNALALQEAACEDSSGRHKWQVLVGAPGYAIASAVYCFNPVPSVVFGGISGSPQPALPPCTERVRGQDRQGERPVSSR